jgi:ATP diphosphatase
MSNQSKYGIADLLRVIQRLRDPASGCPWDLAQDFDSIVESTLEECYELVSAIEHKDFPHLTEELGDVLFQVVFYAQLGAERGLFEFETIVNTLVEKLLRRHPHVFANGELEGLVTEPSNVEEVRQSWELIKQQERQQRQLGGVLDDIPQALPALSRARKVQKRAAQVGFDWSDIAGVLAVVAEELREFDEARGESLQRQEEELGDLLFSCVNLARHVGIDAETALRRATSKFERRFGQIEAQLQTEGLELGSVSAETLELHWNRVKSME